jgi:hypothetical protein
MLTTVLNETGYEESAFGFSLSYNSTKDRAKELFPKFAFKQGGENKFLESIYIWLYIKAPRFWWQEFDTYRVGITKQSESTMHTLVKKSLNQSNFEYHTSEELIRDLNVLIKIYNETEDKQTKSDMFLAIKNNLPEGFLQQRVVCLNYKTLQNMYNQRKNHKLHQWQIFFDYVLNNIEHPEFIKEGF